jgi:peptide/nickel transport system permease protein
MTGALLGISVPSFLLGLFLVLVFAVGLGWFPVAGFRPLEEGLGEHLTYLVLPAIALGAMQAALIARTTRSSMLDVLTENFMKTAKANGSSRSGRSGYERRTSRMTSGVSSSTDAAIKAKPRAVTISGLHLRDR